MIDIPQIVILVLILMVAVIMGLVVVTVFAKFLREAGQRRYSARRAGIEPALEEYLVTGERRSELEALGPLDRDRFLAPLMVERLSFLSGSGREQVVVLARGLGLIDRYLGELGARNRWHRARAAERLGHFGDEDSVQPLTRLLDDEDETVRAVAARSLARLATDGAVEALVRTLDNPSELTRLRVAENLDRIGHPAIPYLVSLLEEAADPEGEDHTYGAILATQVLGGLRAYGGREALSLAAREGATADIRAQATRSLGRIGDPDDVPLLVENTRDPEWPVRTQAANSLGLIGDRGSVPALQALISDRAWWVRLAAGRALVNMGPSGEDALIGLLGSEDRFARERAVAALETRGVTRRLVRELPREDQRGERARRAVSAIAGSGATRYLTDLGGELERGERAALEEILSVAPGPHAPAFEAAEKE